MKLYLALFVALSGLWSAKIAHAQRRVRCTEAQCTAAHGRFEGNACECPDAVLCRPEVPLCSAEEHWPGEGLLKNFVQLVRPSRNSCGCESQGAPIQCDLTLIHTNVELRLIECTRTQTTGSPYDHPGVIPTRLLGLVEAAAAPGGSARLSQEIVGEGECIYLQRMQAQCTWSRQRGCDCTREVEARRRIAAATSPSPETPPPPPVPPPQAVIPDPPWAASPDPEPAPPPVGSGLARPTEPSFGRVPDHAEQRDGGEPPAPQPAELAPPPDVVALEPPPAPPPRVLWEEPLAPTQDLRPLTSEPWMWNRLRLASGYTYNETSEIRTRGGSLEAHLRIALAPKVGIVFGAGAVAGSRSVFVDPFGLAVNPITASPNSEARLMVHWAMLAIHKGETRSRTPRAEGLGASLVLSHAWNLHRNLRIGLAARGTILAVRHEDALVAQRDTHGLAYGLGVLTILELGR